MKNFFKKVHYGALTFIFALALIVTQSAFSTKTTTPNYYQDEEGNWLSLDGKVLGDGPGTYSCDDQVMQICSAYFPAQPDQNATPATGAERHEGKITIN